MDNSIWYEECDKGWLDLIPSIITCEYEENKFTPIKISPHLPEQDLDDFHYYPRCTVQAVDEQFAYDRYESARGTILSMDGVLIL